MVGRQTIVPALSDVFRAGIALVGRLEDVPGGPAAEQRLRLVWVEGVAADGDLADGEVVLMGWLLDAVVVGWLFRGNLVA